MSYYVTEVKISSSSGRACVIFRCHSLSLIDGQLHIIENEANRPNLVALFHWHHEHIFRDFFSVFSQTLKMDANNNYNSEELDSSSPSKAGFNAKVRKKFRTSSKIFKLFDDFFFQNELRTLFVSGLPHDIKPREFSLLFHQMEGLSFFQLRE